MKTLTARFLTLFGIALLATVMAFSALSCDNGNGHEKEKEKDPLFDFPYFLDSTLWHYSSTGNVYPHEENAPVVYFHGEEKNYNEFLLVCDVFYDENGEELKKTYILKKVVYAEGANTYSLLYDEDVTKNNVFIKDEKVTMVNFECIEVKYRNGPWVKTN